VLACLELYLLSKNARRIARPLAPVAEATLFGAHMLARTLFAVATYLYRLLLAV